MFIETERPTICAACCPLILKKKPLLEAKSGSSMKPLLDLEYEIVFAISTLNSIIIYSTASRLPLAHLTGLHYLMINDLRWSPDGKQLCAVSSDGFATFVTFKQGELGEPLIDAKIKFDEDILIRENFYEQISKNSGQKECEDNVEDITEILFQNEQECKIIDEIIIHNESFGNLLDKNKDLKNEDSEMTSECVENFIQSILGMMQ